MVRDWSSLIWSDNWHIEDNKAWFIDGERNMLYCLNLDSRQCEDAVELPDDPMQKFRLNPRCIKCSNDIFCIPDMGKYIWVYQLENFQFQQIEIENPDEARLSIVDFWKYDDKIFAVSLGLKKILEVNIKEKKIENYYDLCSGLEDKIARSVMEGTKIYTVSSVSNHIYQFDIMTKDTIVYTIPDIKGSFHTICFDGENFWLGGYRREIYVWNKENNKVKTIDRFPKQFGIYNFAGNGDDVLDCEAVIYDTPTFYDSVAMEQYIWFIPFRTNKIIYIDKNTYEVNAFEIAEEEETKYSLPQSRLRHKYLLEYVMENRYIGLFSFKNKCILEIDILEKKAKKYSITGTCLGKMIPEHILFEQKDSDLDVFLEIVMSKGSKTEDKLKKCVTDYLLQK